MHQELLTPRARSGVEQIEHLVRRARYRATLQLEGGATSGRVETPPVPAGFAWLLDYATAIEDGGGIPTAALYVNTVAPDNYLSDGGPLDVSPTGAALNAGDRLVLDVTVATADALIGLHVGYRLIELEPRAWPQASPVNVVELIGQRAPGPELVELEEPADG